MYVRRYDVYNGTIFYSNNIENKTEIHTSLELMEKISRRPPQCKLNFLALNKFDIT